MTIKKAISWLLGLLLFLLPWQTRYIYAPASLNGGFWEYGTGSFYASEILLWLIIILFIVSQFRHRELWQRIVSPEHFRNHWRRLFYCSLVLLFFGLEILLSGNRDVAFNSVFRLIEAACLAVILASLPHQGRAGEGLPSFTLPRVSESVSGVRQTPVFSTAQAEATPLSPPLERGESQRLLLAFWLGGVVQGLFALWQFLNQEIIANKWLGLATHNAKQLGDFVIEFGDERWLRAYGSFGSPNILGGWLAITFVLGLILYVRSEPSWQKILLLVGELVVVAGLIVSFSRAAWLAVVVGIVVYAIMSIKNNSWRTQWFDYIKLGVGSLAVVAIFVFTYAPLFTTRFEGRERLEVQSNTTRREEYKTWWQTVKAHPWLGTGPGLYTYALYQRNSKHPVWYYQPIHNTYLLIFAELGIACFLAFSLSCFFVLKYLWKKNPTYLSVVAVLLASALFDHFWWSLYSGVLLTAVVLSFGLSETKNSLE